MKRVLVVEYSQSGDVAKIADAFVRPLERPDVEVRRERIQPVIPYPWRSIPRFFSVFPECASETMKRLLKAAGAIHPRWCPCRGRSYTANVIACGDLSTGRTQSTGTGTSLSPGRRRCLSIGRSPRSASTFACRAGRGQDHPPLRGAGTSRLVHLSRCCRPRGPRRTERRASTPAGNLALHRHTSHDDFLRHAVLHRSGLCALSVASRPDQPLYATPGRAVGRSAGIRQIAP